MVIFQNGFNELNLKTARDILNKHLETAAKEMGIDNISLGSISYDKNTFSTKLSVVSKAKPAAEVGDIKNNIGKTFKSPNSPTKYTLVEVHLEKIIIKTQRRGGKSYKISPSEFQNWLKLD